ncbi:autotransporter outer membrane beta-barrel domain-containing protein [Bordetella petrii]|uniref:autotransporter outer membrane beta-barrel domain-containing protein n=1 Tax=Bordetella petrii TaxID=94624 RepID=UPI001E431976|nr:autotransporter outer membrane beta-barrel domain-containing protein [Bordetella petrii]MCD0503153.1 autotransporter outer membrane beta-barrel domain-containing protein [Bordetella petrii]
MTNTGTIRSAGDHSAAIVLQSIGGGGGHGGDANATGVITAVAIGGSGGAAGDGAQVQLTANGQVATAGANASGVVLQSIGGGGGSAGSATAVSVGVGLNVSLATGGRGGSGGSGGAVLFSQAQQGSIVTAGPHSMGLLAQSIGGGGGSGGLADSRAITIAPPTGDNPTGTVTVAITHGGAGQGAGNGGPVSVDNDGGIATTAEQSHGIVAQSIGGGGGNGGAVVAPLKAPTIGASMFDVQFTLRHGGQGGAGGAGGPVQVANSATGNIATQGTGAAGIVAQSLGGGGGNGGVVQTHDAGSFNDILGSPTSVSGLLAQAATWLESGPEFSVKKTVNLSAGVTLGGSGAFGGAASAFNVRNDGSIATVGAHAPGILAQSIGGGGGNAGAIDSSGASSLLGSLDSLIQAAASGGQNVFTVGLPQFGVTQQVGGDGGFGGDGGGSAASPATVTHTGMLATQGLGSAGIVAQSVGGGGGHAASSGQNLQDMLDAAAGDQAPAILDQITHVINLLGTKGVSALNSLVNLRTGGTDGAGGQGGAVLVDASTASSRIGTQGGQAPGILAQSVGGGGGVSLAHQPLYLWSNVDSTIALGGTGNLPADTLVTSTGGSAAVTHGGRLDTRGPGSAGIVAQSVGGGGGLAALSLHNASQASIGQTGSLAITLGSAYAQSGFGPNLSTLSGGAVSVGNTGTIVTQGSLSPGILAQSVGGGGGIAYVSSDTAQGTASIQLGATGLGAGGFPSNSITGNGGAVTVTQSGGNIISTAGALSFGVLAQSVGAGGGYVAQENAGLPSATPANITFGSSVAVTGTGGPVNVTQDTNATIATSGTNSHGIVAQSIGAGGGIAGLATRAGLATLQAPASPASGAGGAVNVSVSGTVATSGDGAIGVFAQSVGGGGGFTGDQSSASYTPALIQDAGLPGGQGNGGDVSVNVGVGGTVQTTGANAPAILAMSVGGGGVFKDGTLYQYDMPAGTAMQGGKITVNLGQAAQVVSAAANTPALVAVSNGGNGGGQAVSITLDQGALLGANSESGTAILSMSPLSTTTITNAGIIRAGTAINAANQTRVDNSGTVSGHVLMAQGSTFNNLSGGNLYSGPQFQGNLDNAGTLNPGGPGSFQTTRLEGSFNNSGTYSPDLDFGGGKSDFISVSGAATFGGTLAPVLRNPVKGVWMGIGHFDSAQNSIPTVASGSPLFSYQLKNNGPDAWRDPLIAVDGDFTAAALGLSPDRANIARSLQGLWDQGSAGAAALFDKFTAVQDGPQYRAALNRVAHDGQFARAANQMQGSYAAMNRMMSCPAFIGASTLLREGNCTWARVDTNWTRRDGTSADEAYRIRQTALTLGGQHEIHRDWFLGGSLSYADGNTTASGLSADSDTYAAGLALKYNSAPWQVSVAVHGGVEKSRMSRDTLDGVANSKPQSTFVAGRLRTAYEFSWPSWYLRPYVDLDINHIRQKSYQESGAGPFNLKVFSNHTTSYMLSPMIELGGRKDLGDGTTLRGYVAGGASFLRGGDVVTTMQLSGTGAAPFSLRSGMPRTYGNLAAGLEMITSKGLELKTEYALRANKEYRDQVLTLRAAYRF